MGTGLTVGDQPNLLLFLSESIPGTWTVLSIEEFGDVIRNGSQREVLGLGGLAPRKRRFIGSEMKWETAHPSGAVRPSIPITQMSIGKRPS